jgi:hypothetical protein
MFTNLGLTTKCKRRNGGTIVVASTEVRVSNLLVEACGGMAEAWNRALLTVRHPV